MANKQHTLSIVIDRANESNTLDLPLSSQSCWGRFFGQWPLPCQGAIDVLDAAFACDGVRRVTLHGCPSACLLPLLWMRSIWFPSHAPEFVLDWNAVEAPSGDVGRQPAGKLACMLADRIECVDPSRARRLWGIDTTADVAVTEEVFDLLTNIVDLWDTDLQHMAQAADWCESVRRALVNCASLDQNRVGIYGAGTHTRAVGDAMMEPGVEVVCIIDDDARRHGEHLWGYEIVSPQQALELHLDAVIISANSIEDLLWERAEVFRQHGIATTRLYGSSIRPNALESNELRST